MTWRQFTGLAIGAAALLGLALPAGAQDVIRVGCPTKTYFPTILANVAEERGLFEKEGLKPEITVYRGGAETFEAIAAGSADIGVVAVALVSSSRNRGVLTKFLAGAGTEWSGWILGVKSDSTIADVKTLAGKKVGITSAGSGTDALALWAQAENGVEFQRVPVGGGGLVPNLLNGNLEAAVIYSPLSYKVMTDGSVKALIDFGKAMPPNLIGGWAATDKNMKERPEVILKGLNAVYGALEYMRNNRDYAIDVIAKNNELPVAIATMEYEQTFMHLSRDGKMTQASVELALEIAKASGAKDLAPASEIYQNVDITPTQ